MTDNSDWRNSGFGWSQPWGKQGEIAIVSGRRTGIKPIGKDLALASEVELASNHDNWQFIKTG